MHWLRSRKRKIQRKKAYIYVIAYTYVTGGLVLRPLLWLGVII